MAWRYEQSTGRLTHNGQLVATGYSGHGAGLNAPNMQNAMNLGPIPRGSYTIGPKHNVPGNQGIMRLTPKTGTQMFNRSGFLIHGDNAAAHHTASDGCVILPPNIRTQIDNSTDKDLDVVQ